MTYYLLNIVFTVFMILLYFRLKKLMQVNKLLGIWKDENGEGIYGFSTEMVYDYKIRNFIYYKILNKNTLLFGAKEEKVTYSIQHNKLFLVLSDGEAIILYKEKDV